jgi:hypothetical protein
MKNGRILSFPLNLPAIVTLGSSEHTIIQGRYGDRALFTLADGRSMYVPPCVAAKIAEQGIGAGESFELCKGQIRDGRRILIEWAVRRVDTPTESQESQLEHDLRLSVEQAQAKREQAEPEPPIDLRVEPPRGDNGGESKRAGHEPVPRTKLEHALRTAISAAHNAEKFGSELGYVVRFDADAIKSMAITVLINMSDGNRR